MIDLNDLKKTAVEAALESGAYARERRKGDIEISRKRGFNDLVTDVDKQCEKMIIEKIKASYPEHSILAEESGEDISCDQVCWIIDPIDGTTNFAHGFPFYCTSIGVSIDGDIKLGVVYNPEHDELFVAKEGDGAYLNDKKITVSKVGNVKESLVATGFAYNIESKMHTLPFFDKMLKHAQAVRRAGSAALDLCYVACGRFDAFWEFGLNPWDTAAGIIIVKESGGTISKITNEPYSVFEKEILASNGHIHGQMIKLLAK